MIDKIVPGVETRDLFSEAADKVIVEGVKRHEAIHDVNGEDPKEFHCSDHLRRLEARARKLAEVFGLSFEEKQITTISIAWHDNVIKYDKVDPTKLLSMITRHRGARVGDIKGDKGNEAMSAQGMREEMEAKKIFTEEQIKNAVWAVEATYPDARTVSFVEYPFLPQILEQNPSVSGLLTELKELGIEKGLLFSQPHLESYLERGEDVPREVLITALTDLGGAGMDEKEIFFLEGDAEMRELYGNLRIPEVFDRLVNGDESVDQKDREATSQAFLGWLDSQVCFATWQWLRFGKIVFLLKNNRKLNEQEEADLRASFGHYEDNIRASLKRARKAGVEFGRIKNETGEKEAFRYLAKELGYNGVESKNVKM